MTFTNGHKIRCEAVEQGNRCKRLARQRAVLSGGNVIVYSCTKAHAQFLHLNGQWEFELPRGWDKEPTSESSKGAK